MKRVFAGLAAGFLATAAMAQQVTPVEPPPSNPMTQPPTEPMQSPGGEVATLTERDGKWWNGDREATPAEIAAYKQAQKDGRPK